VRIGIFGGTFDPPHLGHLVAAQEAFEHLRLDRVIFVPAAKPPHKLKQAITRAQTRLEMVRAAIAADARFGADDTELKREGPSWTVDTLRELKARDPAAELFLLIGADQVRDFPSWREPAEIQRLATVVLLAREGVDAPPEGMRPGAVVRLPRLDISGTELRRRVQAGEPVRYLVPDAVESIILRERLYIQTHAETASAERGTTGF